MKITIVMGFFLPVPPEAGGATEKSWHRLAHALADRGHEVTVVARCWPGQPDREQQQGVRYLRLPGFDHRRKLWQNLLLDLRWSLRVHRHLPPADITVVHAVTLPAWLGRLRRSAGRVVVMPGRMPKGQYRWYGRLARVVATSTVVRDRVLQENPRLEGLTRVFGYPIDWTSLAQAPLPRPSKPPVTLAFAGRLHPEKGLDLLVEAIVRLQSDQTLPDWRLLLCGPVEVSAGGGGPEYRARLERRLRAAVPEPRWKFLRPIFDEHALAAFYGSADLFCYPSLAAQGETFGVAVAEAMAAGAVPVVSDLACFRDFVRAGVNGLVFSHEAPDAAAQLSGALAGLLREPARRHQLAAAAREEVSRFDFGRYAEALLADFAQLAAPGSGLPPVGDRVNPPQR
ncbi:MAG: glycosyltransferase family 4 protein [Verrucomicrobia bacterium]|nr:glycosyltransferase family 4 protein [Verrucomicrobiota bacterium]